MASVIVSKVTIAGFKRIKSSNLTIAVSETNVIIVEFAEIKGGIGHRHWRVEFRRTRSRKMCVSYHFIFISS